MLINIMKKMQKTLKISIFFSALLLVLPGCIKTTKMVGYTFENKEVKDLNPGTTSKDDVFKILGSPSAVSMYGNETWYYISAEYQSIAFLDPKVKKAKVIAIEFGKNNVIDTVDNYDQDDFANIDVVKDYTKTEGHDVGILGQLLGNVGRFNSEGGGKRDITKPKGRI